MSKKRKNYEKVADAVQSMPTMDATKVRIANGAGQKPIILEYKQGETFAQLFKRAGVKVSDGRTVTTGKIIVRNFKDQVEPGSTITIANRPNNG